MAKLFDDIFGPDGTGDVTLLLIPPGRDLQDVPEEEIVRLRCHSPILMQHPYFCKMLSNEVREAIVKEIVIPEPRDEFLAIVKFMYTGHIDIGNHHVAQLLTLTDKYCLDEVVDLCLRYLKDNFDAEMFYTFHNFSALNAACQEKLREQLMAALQQRKNLCAVTEHPGWPELPIDTVEVILSKDELPVSSETEVLTLITQWMGPHRRTRQEVAKLLGAFRMTSNTMVRVSDIDHLMQGLGFDVLSTLSPRTGSAVWDPEFVVHRHDNTGPAPLHSGVELQHKAEHKDCIYHQLGAKDFLQQEPGWMHPGVYRCRVTLSCSSWSHRERRLMRSSPTQAAALQKRAFDCGPPSSRDRSPSPPPPFQVRMPPSREAFEGFDIAQKSDGSETGILAGGVIRNLSQDKVDHEIVDHQILCGVSSGYQRHGVRISQREPNAIYLAEDLKGESSTNIGGTTTSVTFDLELRIGEAPKSGISKCQFALQRNHNTLLEEWFDASAKVPLRLYITSSSFDKNSSYSVTLRWLKPGGADSPPSQRYYIGQ